MLKFICWLSLICAVASSLLAGIAFVYKPADILKAFPALRPSIEEIEKAHPEYVEGFTDLQGQRHKGINILKHGNDVSRYEEESILRRRKTVVAVAAATWLLFSTTVVARHRRATNTAPK